MQCKTLLFVFLIFFLSFSIFSFVAPKLAVNAASWNEAETWSIELSHTGSWHIVETWTVRLQPTPHWSSVETWTIKLAGLSNWQNVENWTIVLYSRTWYSVENWTVLLNATATWFDVETWDVNITSHLPGFHDVETWDVNVTALKRIIGWDPLIKFHLTCPDTYVGFDSVTYFDNFTWDCGYISFANIYMDSGTPIPTLTVSMVGGNVSFGNISYLDLVSFRFFAATGATVTLYLTGLNTMPYNVTIDGDAYSAGTRWTWDGTIFTVFYVMPSTTSQVFLSWGAITTVWNNAETWSLVWNPSTIITGVTWYYRSNTITANTITGYELSETMDHALTSCTQNLGVSSDIVQFGFSAFMVNSHNESVSLTGDEPTAIMTRGAVGEGGDSGTISISETALALGMDTIDVKLYIRLSLSTWLLSAEFTTQRLMYTRLIASSWQFDLYTKMSLDASNNVIATVYWGDSTHVSGISGLSFQIPTPQEISIYYAGHGDWIHAVLYPYMIYAGDGVYGLGFLFVGGVLYLRHKKWEVILVMLFLFGGAGGVGLLIPDAAYRLLYVVVALALAWLLTKVFK